jgi:hypothetical protein
VAEFFLHAGPWLQYIEYLKRSQGATDDEKFVVQRGLLNFPWNMALWSALVRVAERAALECSEPNSTTLEQLSDIVRCAAPNVMQSQDTAGAERLALRIVQVFHRCGGTLSDPDATACQTAMTFNDSATTSWAIVKRQVAFLEPNAAISLQSIDDVVTVIPGQSRWWLEFSRLTEDLGDDTSVLKVFKRALAAVFDKNEDIAISNGLLSFEGHCSTVSMPPGLAYDDGQASIDRRLGKERSAPVAMAVFISRNGDVQINCNKRGPPALPKPKKEESQS